MSAAPFLLLTGDDGAMLIPPQLKERDEPVFADYEDDRQASALLNHLRKKPRTPVLILADTLAQEFHRDTLPRLNILDKDKLLRRRLHQRFPEPSTPHTQLTAAITLKNNNALYACLHDESPVGAWVKRLESLSNPFSGVVPLPLACAGLIAKLLPEAHKGWSLLLSWQRTGGFRQIVTHDGEFVFTRLTPSVPFSTHPGHIAMMLVNDVQATRDYLVRLGLSNESLLRVIAILPDELHNSLRALPPPIQAEAIFTPQQAAQRLGLAYAPPLHDPTSDLVFAAWLKKQKRLRPVMLPAAKKKIRTTSRIKKAGLLAALTLNLFALGSAGWQGHDLLRLFQDNRAATQSLAGLREQWERERTALTPVTEPLGRLRQAVARRRLFAEPTVLPWPLLQTVNQAIGTEARLINLDWQRERDNSETLQFTLRLTSRDLPPLDQDLGRQEVIHRFDLLALALHLALPGYDVAVARYPFLIKQDDSVTNATDSQDTTGAPTADFILRKEIP